MARLTLASSYEEIRAQVPELFLKAKVDEFKRAFRSIDENDNGKFAHLYR